MYGLPILTNPSNIDDWLVAASKEAFRKALADFRIDELA
jgi:hypothetical protein